MGAIQGLLRSKGRDKGYIDHKKRYRRVISLLIPLTQCSEQHYGHGFLFQEAVAPTAPFHGLPQASRRSIQFNFASESFFGVSPWSGARRARSCFLVCLRRRLCQPCIRQPAVLSCITRSLHTASYSSNVEADSAGNREETSILPVKHWAPKARTKSPKPFCAVPSANGTRLVSAISSTFHGRQHLVHTFARAWGASVRGKSAGALV